MNHNSVYHKIFQNPHQYLSNHNIPYYGLGSLALTFLNIESAITVHLMWQKWQHNFLFGCVKIIGSGMVLRVLVINLHLKCTLNNRLILSIL